jgi:hypothetical protein
MSIAAAVPEQGFLQKQEKLRLHLRGDAFQLFIKTQKEYKRRTRNGPSFSIFKMFVAKTRKNIQDVCICAVKEIYEVE